MSSWRPARWIFGFLSLTIVAAMFMIPAAVTAQSGPQFGNWGPGMSPPDSEGVDPTPSSSAGYGSSLAQPFAPGIAPGVAGADSALAPAPGFSIRGCPYDLRGIW